MLVVWRNRGMKKRLIIAALSDMLDNGTFEYRGGLGSIAGRSSHLAAHRAALWNMGEAIGKRGHSP